MNSWCWIFVKSLVIMELGSSIGHISQKIYLLLCILEHFCCCGQGSLTKQDKDTTHLIHRLHWKIYTLLTEVENVGDYNFCHVCPSVIKLLTLQDLPRMKAPHTFQLCSWVPTNQNPASLDPGIFQNFSGTNMEDDDSTRLSWTFILYMLSKLFSPAPHYRIWVSEGSG